MSTDTRDEIAEARLSLDTFEIRRIACDPRVLADPRSVRRELEEPGSVRGIVGERIRRALVERGIIPRAEFQSDRRSA